MFFALFYISFYYYQTVGNTACPCEQSQQIMNETIPFSTVLNYAMQNCRCNKDLHFLLHCCVTYSHLHRCSQYVMFLNPLLRILRFLWFFFLLKNVICLYFFPKITHLLHFLQGFVVSVIFCGDFNSTPNTQLMQYIRNRKISKSDRVWHESEY